ncbi:MAG: glycosyltransferase family 39 protein [Candidatus Brocadiia bacterium]|jgi:hypothetical protein
MMPGLILSFVLALLMGMAVATLLWPRRRLQADLLMKVSLATGLGLGATSCLSFLYLVAARGHLDNLPVAELVVLAVLVTCAVLRHSPGKPALAGLKESGPLTLAAPAAALAVFLMGAATFALDSACWPHGDWDAWSVQNLHARFLYRGGEQWVNLFSKPLSWSSLDYPLLLPGSVMRSWVFAGGETVLGPILVAFVFVAGACLLLFSGLALLRGKLRGSLAVIVLAGTPFFIGHAAAQYADVPLAFFYLATLVLLCLADREREGGRGLLALAGLACGMAAWTKNEGLLFMICVLLPRVWTLIRKSGPRTCWSWAWPFLAGLLPVLLIVLFFKGRYAPPNEIVGPAGREGALQWILTPSRYAAIGKWFLKHAFTFGRWDELRYLPITPVPLLLGALFLFGIRRDGKEFQGALAAAWTLGLTWAGYLSIYLITPNPLDWQLTTAGGRLLIQLWPSALFVFFMVIRDPLSESLP